MVQPNELEDRAKAYAKAAITFEVANQKEKAIDEYRKAVDCLDELVLSYPKYGFGNVYREWAAVYQEKMGTLRTDLLTEKKKEPSTQSVSPQKAEPVLPQKCPMQPDLAMALEILNKKIDALTTLSIAPKTLAPPEDTLSSVLDGLNQKLDALTASVTELTNEVAHIKLNTNDTVSKIEHTQKEITEIKTLIYSLKYDR
jgi:hypothetical protein